MNGVTSNLCLLFLKMECSTEKILNSYIIDNLYFFHLGTSTVISVSGKDIVPRYKRILQQGANLDDVSLRPSANSMVCKPPNLKQTGGQNSG